MPQAKREMIPWEYAEFEEIRGKTMSDTERFGFKIDIPFHRVLIDETVTDGWIS